VASSLWPPFPFDDVAYFPALALLVSRTFGVDLPWSAVCAFMHVWHELGRLVVAHDMLPGVALLAQDGEAIVVGEAADALDRGRLFLLGGAIERGRVDGEGWRRRAVVEGGGSWLRFSVRLDRRDVCHNLADTLNERVVRCYCG
jgi:hypothetical protein